MNNPAQFCVTYDKKRRIVLVSESGLNYTARMPIPDTLEKPRYSDYSDTIPINRPITKFDHQKLGSI